MEEWNFRDIDLQLTTIPCCSWTPLQMAISGRNNAVVEHLVLNRGSSIHLGFAFFGLPFLDALDLAVALHLPELAVFLWKHLRAEDRHLSKVYKLFQLCNDRTVTLQNDSATKPALHARTKGYFPTDEEAVFDWLVDLCTVQFDTPISQFQSPQTGRSVMQTAGSERAIKAFMALGVPLYDAPYIGDGVLAVVWTAYMRGIASGVNYFAQAPTPDICKLGHPLPPPNSPDMRAAVRVICVERGVPPDLSSHVLHTAAQEDLAQDSHFLKLTALQPTPDLFFRALRLGVRMTTQFGWLIQTWWGGARTLRKSWPNLPETLTAVLESEGAKGTPTRTLAQLFRPNSLELACVMLWNASAGDPERTRLLRFAFLALDVHIEAELRDALHMAAAWLPPRCEPGAEDLEAFRQAVVSAAIRLPSEHYEAVLENLSLLVRLAHRPTRPLLKLLPLCSPAKKTRRNRSLSEESEWSECEFLIDLSNRSLRLPLPQGSTTAKWHFTRSQRSSRALCARAELGDCKSLGRIEHRLARNLESLD